MLYLNRSFAHGFLRSAGLLGFQSLLLNEGLLLGARVPVALTFLMLGEVGGLVRVLVAVHTAVQRRVVDFNAGVVLYRFNLGALCGSVVVL